MKLLFPPIRTLVPVFLLLFPAIQYAQNGEIPRFNPPKQYYLALGDSMHLDFNSLGSTRTSHLSRLPSLPQDMRMTLRFS